MLLFTNACITHQSVICESLSYYGDAYMNLLEQVLYGEVVFSRNKSVQDLIRGLH